MAPLEVTTCDLDENSGAGQVIATVDNAVEGETLVEDGHALREEHRVAQVVVHQRRDRAVRDHVDV